MITINELGALWCALAVGALLGHNLWLVAQKEAAAPADKLRLSVNTSDLFPLSETAIAPERIAAFELLTATGKTPLKNFLVAENALIAEVGLPRAGLALAALTLHPRQITLDAEKFAHYLQEEEAHAVSGARRAHGQDEQPGREVYTKYAKAIVQCGGAPDETFRQIVGQRLEIIPEINPATLRAGDHLPVRVLRDGLPAAGLRVTSGCDRLKSGAPLAHWRTDETGRAAVAIAAPGRWFVRTHFIGAHHDAAIADWESFWSSLTFVVP